MTRKATYTTTPDAAIEGIDTALMAIFNDQGTTTKEKREIFAKLADAAKKMAGPRPSSESLERVAKPTDDPEPPFTTFDETKI